MTTDFRDIALQDAALDHVLLLERIASLEADIKTYRLIAASTMDALHAVTLQRDALQRQYDEQTAEYRSFREEILIADQKDDAA
jgi:hypothetical protein